MFALAQRLATSPRALAALGVGAIAMAGAGWIASRPVAVPQVQLVGQTVDAPQTATVLIFVSGAVAHPGLYELSPDARVADAIAAAGGVTTAADPGHMPDLAARVHDGRQVNVPFLRSSTSSAAKLDVNTAAADELDAVPGMPPGLAEAIVQYREEWGPFLSMSQLRSDLGVDSATLSGLEHYLRIAPLLP